MCGITCSTDVIHLKHNTYINKCITCAAKLAMQSFITSHLRGINITCIIPEHNTNAITSYLRELSTITGWGGGQFEIEWQ